MLGATGPIVRIVENPWATYVLPSVAIIVSVVVAAIGWWMAVRASEGTQKLAAQLGRESKAHDDLVAFLGRLMAWHFEARHFLLYTASGWSARITTGRTSAFEDFELDQAILDRLAASADSFVTTGGRASDAALFFPFSSELRSQLDAIVYSLDQYCGMIARAAEIVSRRDSPSPIPSDVEEFRLGGQCAGMIVEFCRDVRVMIQTYHLKRCGYDVSETSMDKPSGNWIQDGRDGKAWTVKKKPPYLPDVYLGQDRMLAAYAEELRSNDYAG